MRPIFPSAPLWRFFLGADMDYTTEIAVNFDAMGPDGFRYDAALRTSDDAQADRLALASRFRLHQYRARRRHKKRATLVEGRPFS